MSNKTTENTHQYLEIMLLSINIVLCFALLICVVIIFTSLFIGEPLVYLPILNSIEASFLLFGYNVIVVSIAGFICLLISLSIPNLLEREKKYSYIFTYIGSLLLVFSISIVPIVIKNLKYWKDLSYIYLCFTTVGLIIMTFSKKIEKENKAIGKNLENTSILLIVLGSVAFYFK